MRVSTVLFVLLAAIISASVALSQDAATDERLAQTVTIDCVGVRLHTAVERLSAQTGVLVRSGKNAEDWKVRDVPVLVCSRDLPLGVLLRGIADANHLLFSRRKVDDVYTYRIWRDLKRETELAELQDSRWKAAVAAARYDWDAISQVKDLPESAFVSDDSFTAENRSQVRALSKILSKLGPEVRDRVLSGEKIVLGNLNTPQALRSDVQTALQCLVNSHNAGFEREGDVKRESLDKMGNHPYILIDFGRYPDYQTSLRAELYLKEGMWHYQDFYHQEWLQKHLPEMGAKPKVPDSASFVDELGPPYIKLKPLDNTGPEALNVKFMVAKPKDKKTPTHEDLLLGMSEDTGYSIIAEGTVARSATISMLLANGVSGLFDREVTVRDVLAVTSRAAVVDWYLDERHKLIIGRDKAWTQRLANLVPEKLILDLNTKLQGKGVELDDLAPCIGLTQGQISEWISTCPEFPAVTEVRRPALNVSDDRLCGLYFALGRADRARAMAGQPVPLASVDKGRLRATLLRQLEIDLQESYMNGRDDPKSLLSLLSMERKGELSEDSPVPALRLRIMTMKSPWAGSQGHSYLISIEEKDGTLLTQRFLSAPFPIRAPSPPKTESVPG